MTKSLAHQLAEYACSLRFEDLSKEVVHEVKRRVIDSIGCALGAWNEEPCVIARTVASDFSAKHGGTIIGTDHQAPPDWAAFATGCCIRYFDYNDTYLSKEPAHPSDNIAAALAVAESVGATGQELITAIALAYEVQCRLCDAASIRARGWDHPTYGAFSTALAAARLMKLDPEKTRHAVNIAGVAGMGMRQSRVGELSHWKGVAFANAARHGVYSALLARGGMTGPAPIFEGQMGFEKQLGISLGDVGLRIRQEEGGDAGRRAGLNDLEDQHQILAGRVSQPERNRSGIVSAKGNRRSGKNSVSPDRESRRLGGHHRERTGKMETGDAGNG